jgi:hypothetical protein
MRRVYTVSTIDQMPDKTTDAPCSMRTGWTCWNDSAGHWHTFGSIRVTGPGTDTCPCCREYPTPDCACDCHQNVEPPGRGPSPVAAESSTAAFSSGPVAPSTWPGCDCGWTPPFYTHDSWHARWVECRSAVPASTEDGAVSAIADHSPDSGARPMGQQQGPGIDPEDEATEAAEPSYDRRQGLRPMERKLVIALAEARLAMQQDPTGESRRFLDAAYALCDLFPVIACHGCGIRFVQGDARKTMWCSERCRYRIGQRNRRARLKAEATL